MIMGTFPDLMFILFFCIICRRFGRFFLWHSPRLLQCGGQNPFDLPIRTAEFIGSPSFDGLENLRIDT